MRNSKGFCINAPKGEYITVKAFTVSMVLLLMWIGSGFTHVCVLGETGLLVSKITDIAPFVGYANNQQQTEKKRLRNVFKRGDLYFNSGDLLRIDQENFIYFQDRVGDTFRFSILLLKYAYTVLTDGPIRQILIQLFLHLLYADCLF